MTFFLNGGQQCREYNRVRCRLTQAAAGCEHGRRGHALLEGLERHGAVSMVDVRGYVQRSQGTQRRDSRMFHHVEGALAGFSGHDRHVVC